MEFNTLPNLQNTGLTIIEIVLWLRIVGSENMQTPDFFDTIWRSFSVLNRGRRRVKTLQILIEFFYCFIKTLNLFPNELADELYNKVFAKFSFTIKFQLLTNFTECFATCS